MKKATRRELKMALKKDVNKAMTRRLRHKVCRKVGKLTGKLALIGLVGFAVTFTIYIFNLENKLIYYGVYPLLQKHYNKQTRDRRI